MLFVIRFEVLKKKGNIKSRQITVRKEIHYSSCNKNNFTNRKENKSTLVPALENVSAIKNIQ